MTFRGRANQGLILLATTALWATGCGGGDDEEPAGQPDAFVGMGGAGGGMGGEGGGMGGAGGGGMSEERSRLSFVRRAQFRDGSPTTTTGNSMISCT